MEGRFKVWDGRRCAAIDFDHLFTLKTEPQTRRMDGMLEDAVPISNVI